MIYVSNFYNSFIIYLSKTRFKNNMNQYFNTLKINNIHFRNFFSIVEKLYLKYHKVDYSILPDTHIDFTCDFAVIKNQYDKLNKDELSQDYFIYAFKETLTHKNINVSLLFLDHIKEEHIARMARECITSHNDTLIIHLLDSPKYNPILCCTKFNIMPKNIRQENDFIYFAALYNKIKVMEKILTIPILSHYISNEDNATTLLATCIQQYQQPLAEVLLSSNKLSLTKMEEYINETENKLLNLEENNRFSYCFDTAKIIKKHLFKEYLDDIVPHKNDIKMNTRKTKI